MNVADYDKALYYTHRSQWDNLLILMVRTQDDLLSKRIEHFLHAYQFNQNDADVEKCLYGLLQYIDHASETAAAEVYSQPMYT
ncbi:YhdB family protein [Bacillus altitudinis]|uniref:YhdB family protein n=1 Tax=Bacillus altitudinis TaxID=293387 RepID=UPI0022831A8A|nr:YhdB family protein [Bacillus altitudinis]MCY7670400.1 YhdB family protein [Bacillus altitudinis]